jgi:hypothetical protein
MRDLSGHLLNRTVEPSDVSSHVPRIQYVSRRPSNSWLTFKPAFITTALSLICEVILIITLVHNKWFYVDGGGCNRSFLNLRAFLDLKKRVEVSTERSKVSKFAEIVVYKYDDLVNCVDFNILLMMRLLIIFIFVLILLTFLLIVIDVFEDQLKLFAFVRKYFVVHIINIILCLVINGMSFILTERLYEQQYITRFKKGE